MGSNNNSYGQNKTHYNCVVVAKSSCVKNNSTSKSNLVRVTSSEINNGRSQAYKHLIP